MLRNFTPSLPEPLILTYIKTLQYFKMLSIFTPSLPAPLAKYLCQMFQNFYKFLFF